MEPGKYYAPSNVRSLFSQDTAPGYIAFCGVLFHYYMLPLDGVMEGRSVYVTRTIKSWLVRLNNLFLAGMKKEPASLDDWGRCTPWTK